MNENHKNTISNNSHPKIIDSEEKEIAETLLQLHKNIAAVLKKTKKYSGKFRLPKLKIIAGEKRKETEHKENNVRLKLNVEKVYFSSRLRGLIIEI